MKNWLLILCLTAGMHCAYAANPVRLCQDDVDVYPWHMASGQGLSNILLAQVSKRIGVPIETDTMPWKRCLAMVQIGQMDAAIAASFTEERTQFGVYPQTRQGQLDRKRRMSDETYVLFALASAAPPLIWNGKKLSGGELPIGAQLGYSVVGTLRGMGAQVDDSDKQPELIFRKLLSRQIAAGVLLSNQGRNLLRNPRYADKIIELEPPVTSRDGYLLFSKVFTQKNPGVADRFWDEIARVRESAEYQSLIIKMLSD